MTKPQGMTTHETRNKSLRWAAELIVRDQKFFGNRHSDFVIISAFDIRVSSFV